MTERPESSITKPSDSARRSVSLPFPFERGDWVCLASLATLLHAVMVAPRYGALTPISALLRTGESLAAGAVLATMVVAATRGLFQGWGRLGPGSWLCLIDGLRTVGTAGLGRSTSFGTSPPYVLYGVLSAGLFLVPLFVGRLTTSWRNRLSLLIAFHLAPLVMRVVGAAADWTESMVDPTLGRLVWLPDLVGSFLFPARNRDRTGPPVLPEADSFDVVGTKFFVIHVVIVAVTTVWWYFLD